MNTHKSPTGCRPGQLFGLWLMDADRLEEYRARALSVDLGDLARMNREADALDQAAGVGPAKPYAVADGVAVIDVTGPTTKHVTSFQRMLGGTSTVATQRALRQAVADPDVAAILMHYEDAPGGTVAGAYELHEEIRRAAAAKPLDAHVTDVGTSAAYLFASAARRVTANRTAAVGSIGTRAQLVDVSAKFEKDGIRVIPIAAGKFKAAGLPGTPITAEHVAEAQRNIDALNELFVRAVADGRRLEPAAVRDTEARVYLAPDALRLGLIDGVCSFEDAMSALASQSKSPPTAARGPVGQGVPVAAPNDRSSDMELLASIREVFGAAEMTDAQAVDRVRALIKAQPRAADPSILAERASLACERVDILLERGVVLPPQADRLKALLAGADGKTPNPVLLGEGTPYKALLDVIAAGDPGEQAKAADRLAERATLAAPARPVPGNEGDAAAKAKADGDAAHKQGEDWKNAQLAARGLK